MFPRPEVSRELANFVTVSLYTDRGTPEDLENQKRQLKWAGDPTLPVYVVLSPDEKVLKVHPGMQRDESVFLRFLREGLEEFGKGKG